MVVCNRVMKNKGYLLPTEINPDESICLQVSIPNDPFHIAAFYGALTSLAQWYSWEKTGDDRGKQSADVWRGVIENIVTCSEGETMPVDFQVISCVLHWRVLPDGDWVALGNVCGDECVDCGYPDVDFTITGCVLKWRVLPDGDWIELGNVCGDSGDSVVYGGFDAIANASVQPFDPLNPDSFDKYCFASHMLAVEYADTAVDILQFTRLQVSLAIPTIEYGATLLTSWLPAFDNILPATVRFATDILLAGYDYVLSNVDDIEALQFASEQIFCALRLSYPNFDAMFDFIDFPAGIEPPDIIEALGDINIFDLQNWDDVVQFAIDTFVSGEEWGWLILFFARINQTVATLPVVGTTVTDSFRFPNKLSKVVPQMMANAAFFDSRNCEDYGCTDDTWCAEFDLTSDTIWNVASYSDFGSQPFSIKTSAGFEDAVVNGFPTGTKRRFCHIVLDIPEAVTITSIQFTCVISNAAGGGFLNVRQSDNSSASVITDYEQLANFDGASGSLLVTGTYGGIRKLAIAAGVGACFTESCVPAGDALITGVRMSGIGTMPFDSEYLCEGV